MSRNSAAAQPASVADDMSPHAQAFASRLKATIFILLMIKTIGSEEITCSGDGLYADYDTDCREYVRCARGVVTGRYQCGPERAFSEAASACVPLSRQTCIRRTCGPKDSSAYATPGTACRQYYRCDNGTAIDHICPSGTWFDLEHQACTTGAGTCYEPLCTGLPNGEYPDASHECRRMLSCSGGDLQAVFSCNGVCSTNCPPARSVSIPLPAGDADFCSDEGCSSLCENALDGAYPDRVAGCREYFVCDARRVTRRGVCEPGLLFHNGGCKPMSPRVFCPPPARSPCFNRVDGLHRDWRDCASWFECRRERVIGRGTCDSGLVFDGTTCVAAGSFRCEREWKRECEGRPSGTYQDLGSNCTQFFHCERGYRTMMECPEGHVFDGAKCSPAQRYLCPSLESDSCFGRPDSRYRALDAGCRGYYVCSGGERAMYACAPGEVFDGESCVQERPGLCDVEDFSCAGLSDGYHPEIESSCHRYFYCERGDRLVTLSCLGGKIFDGHACVEPNRHQCGALPKESIENGGKYCERDGFFLQQGTECRQYYFCVLGMRTHLTCPEHQVFNGQICVSKNQYTCPG